jgi:metacaspase-1
MTLAILTSIVLLGQAGKSEQAKPSRPLPARYALLVGVGEYPLVPEWKLNGPPNDVRLWRELLVDRFKFPDDEQHIRALSDLTGRSRPELLPTRGNIEREIKALAKVLKRGDILFILLSGHGSQQPADFGRAGNYEPDGADEVFLTRDTNRYIREPGKPKGSFPNAIVDDDLREWVDPLVGDQTGALVWIVMDCCHSGTGLRGERPRNPTVGTMPEAERVAAQQEARQRYRENGN